MRQQERRLLRGSGSGSLRVALWLIGVFGIITIVVVVVLACAGWFTSRPRVRREHASTPNDRRLIARRSGVATRAGRRPVDLETIRVATLLVSRDVATHRCLVAKDQMVPDRRSSTVEPVPPRDEEALPAFRCGHCGHVFHVQDAVPGSQFICPNCGAANNV